MIARTSLLTPARRRCRGAHGAAFPAAATGGAAADILVVVPDALTPGRRPAGAGEPAAATARRRGRRAAATREDVLALVMHRYLRGLRVDVQAIAAELGL